MEPVIPRETLLHQAILDPGSIVVVGASADTGKIGGRIIKNLLSQGYKGSLYGIHPRERVIQGIPCPSMEELPPCDLAIICVAAEQVYAYVETLALQKGTRGFIVVSAGFGESGPEGVARQQRLLSFIERIGGTLIGPNCTGILSPSYAGAFAGPIPHLIPSGVDLVSGSGATAAFITERGIALGVPFSSVISVGNSAQIGIEEILAHWDRSFDPASSSRVKALYVEQLRDPGRFLKHARSLRTKGCTLVAIKAGRSEAGARAASSHTGALTTQDTIVDALLKKSGVIRCFSREELVATLTLCLQYPRLREALSTSQVPRIAIVTHAGGPGVILTDRLSDHGFSVPQLRGYEFSSLLTRLAPGSSVANPIDFLATGSAEQLSDIINTLQKASCIDAIVVIFGSPGLTSVEPAYHALVTAMQHDGKPVFAILPSPVTADQEMQVFRERGIPYFTDEAEFADALARWYTNELWSISPSEGSLTAETRDTALAMISQFGDGYLPLETCIRLMDLYNIPHVATEVAASLDAAMIAADRIGYPLVMKVHGPIHKSDLGGVVKNLHRDEIATWFARFMELPGADGVILQRQLTGEELFIGAIREKDFGHVVFCGLGGIFIEVLKDTATALHPINQGEAERMIRSLRGYELFKGVRGRDPLSEESYIQMILAVSDLLSALPEIQELDLNPIIADGDAMSVVDVRISISRTC